MQPAGHTSRSTATLAQAQRRVPASRTDPVYPGEVEGGAVSLPLSILPSRYGQEGESLKPSQLCSSASHGSRAMTEPAGNPPDGSSPRHKPASPQWSSAGGARAAPALRLPLFSGCRAAGRRGMLLPTAAEGQPPLHTRGAYSKPSSAASAMAPDGAKPAWSSTGSTSSSKLLPMQTMQFVPVLSISAQEAGPHVSETTLSVFQAIAPNQTLVIYPGSNSSRVKSCKLSNVWRSLVFILRLMRQQEPRLTVTALSCAISAVVDYSKEKSCA